MAGVEHPTNASAARPLVQGEAQAIEEQTQGAPIGPEQRGRPPAAPAMAAPIPAPMGPTPNTGLISEVVPQRSAVAHAQNARPATPQEHVGMTLLGMPGISMIARRFALAMAGFPQPGTYNENPPRSVPQPLIMTTPYTEEEAMAGQGADCGGG